jgi:hypothetical protein
MAGVTGAAPDEPEESGAWEVQAIALGTPNDCARTVAATSFIFDWGGATRCLV